MRNESKYLPFQFVYKFLLPLQLCSSLDTGYNANRENSQNEGENFNFSEPSASHVNDDLEDFSMEIQFDHLEPAAAVEMTLEYRSWLSAAPFILVVLLTRLLLDNCVGLGRNYMKLSSKLLATPTRCRNTWIEVFSNYKHLVSARMKEIGKRVTWALHVCSRIKYSDSIKIGIARLEIQLKVRRNFFPRKLLCNKTDWMNSRKSTNTSLVMISTSWPAGSSKGWELFRNRVEIIGRYWNHALNNALLLAGKWQSIFLRSYERVKICVGFVAAVREMSVRWRK